MVLWIMGIFLLWIFFFLDDMTFKEQNDFKRLEVCFFI